MRDLENAQIYLYIYIIYHRSLLRCIHSHTPTTNRTTFQIQMSRPPESTEAPTTERAKMADPDNSDDELTEGKRAYHNRLVKQWTDRKRSVPDRRGRLRFRTTFRNTILDVCKAKGWKHTDSETDWYGVALPIAWLRPLDGLYCIVTSVLKASIVLRWILSHHS